MHKDKYLLKCGVPQPGYIFLVFIILQWWWDIIIDAYRLFVGVDRLSLRQRFWGGVLFTLLVILLIKYGLEINPEELLRRQKID